MRPKTAKHTSISPIHEQSDASFYLVSRLLLETLVENYGEVVIKASSGNFYYDPETRIKSSGSIRVLITGADLAESGTRTEISISGVIESQCPVQCSYTLYFMLKRDMAVIQRTATHMENVIGRSLDIHFKKPSESLHDSLFCLSLNRVNAPGEDYPLGEGRGFLVFAKNEPITDN